MGVLSEIEEIKMLNEQVLELMREDSAAWKRRQAKAVPAAPRAAAEGETWQPCAIRLRTAADADGSGKHGAFKPQNCIAAYIEENCVRYNETQIDMAYVAGLGQDEYSNFRRNLAWADEDLLWKLFYGLVTRDLEQWDDIEAALEAWRKLICRYWDEQVEFVPAGQPQRIKARADVKHSGKFAPDQAGHELMAYLYARLPDEYEKHQDVYKAAGIAPVTWGQLRDNHYRHAWNEGVLVKAAQAAQMDLEETRELFHLAATCRTLRGYLMEALLMMDERPENPDDMLWPTLMQWFRTLKDQKSGTLEKKVEPILLKWK